MSNYTGDFRYVIYNIENCYWWLGSSAASFVNVTKLDTQLVLPIFFHKLSLMEGVFDGI